MNKTGMNLENVKIKNKSTILKLLNDQGSMSRKDISEKVSLTPASVTMLCAEMMSENMLVEKGSIAGLKKVGRKKILVSINYRYKSILSISIEKKHTYIFVCDLKGDIINQKKIPTDTSISPYDFLMQLSKECKELLWDCNQNIENILGIGICIPGIVDRKRGVSVNAYGIWKEEVEIQKYMQTFMNCHIEVENNVKAFAEGELVYGLGRKYNNLLFVKWGPGVGSAIIINNQIYEGKDNKAAEIGHYVLDSCDNQCQCGRKGCLETQVSTLGILKDISEIYSMENTPILYNITNGDVNNLSEDTFTKNLKETENIPSFLSDEPVLKIIEENIEKMSHVVVNIITMLAPNHTIIFGSILDNKFIEDKFIKCCEKYDSSYNKDNISKSNINDKRHSIGSTALIAKKYFFENTEKTVPSIVQKSN